MDCDHLVGGTRPRVDATVLLVKAKQSSAPTFYPIVTPLLLQHQSAVDQLFQGIVGWLSNLKQDPMEQGEVMHFTNELSHAHLVTERRPIAQWDCYERAVDTLQSSCANLKLHQVGVLV